MRTFSMLLNSIGTNGDKQTTEYMDCNSNCKALISLSLCQNPNKRLSLNDLVDEARKLITLAGCRMCEA